LFVCGASSAFLGLLGAIIGVGGLFGANRPKATAVVGLVLSILGLWLFFWVLAALRQ
jgi:cytochrome c biogenesis protein CcdA